MGIPAKTLLRPGDILLLMDEPTNTTWNHKMIKVGQAVTSLNVSRGNQGSSSLVHAVIWTRTIGNNEPESPRPAARAACVPLSCGLATMWCVGLATRNWETGRPKLP